VGHWRLFCHRKGSHQKLTGTGALELLVSSLLSLVSNTWLGLLTQLLTPSANQRRVIEKLFRSK